MNKAETSGVSLFICLILLLRVGRSYLFPSFLFQGVQMKIQCISPFFSSALEFWKSSAVISISDQTSPFGWETLKGNFWNNSNETLLRAFIIANRKPDEREISLGWVDYKGKLKECETQSLSSSQPLKLIKKPFNFIVMWLAIKYITSIYQYMRRKGKRSGEKKRNLKAQRKAIKIKATEIKSKDDIASSEWLSTCLDYLFSPSVMAKFTFCVAPTYSSQCAGNCWRASAFDRCEDWRQRIKFYSKYVTQQSWSRLQRRLWSFVRRKLLMSPVQLLSSSRCHSIFLHPHTHEAR